MDKVLFAGPWVKFQGMLPQRVVLHAHYNKDGDVTEYMVHEQYYNEAGRLGYDSGHYYPRHYDNAFERSLDKFWERCRNKYHAGSEAFIVEDPAVMSAAIKVCGGDEKLALFIVQSMRGHT